MRDHSGGVQREPAGQREQARQGNPERDLERGTALIESDQAPSPLPRIEVRLEELMAECDPLACDAYPRRLSGWRRAGIVPCPPGGGDDLEAEVRGDPCVLTAGKGRESSQLLGAEVAIRKDFQRGAAEGDLQEPLRSRATNSARMIDSGSGCRGSPVICAARAGQYADDAMGSPSSRSLSVTQTASLANF